MIGPKIPVLPRLQPAKK